MKDIFFNYFIYVCIIGMIVGLVMLMVTEIKIKKLEQKQYELKQDKYWDIFIKHYDEFKPYCYNNKSPKAMLFNWNNRYEIIVWNEQDIYSASVAVYDNTDCVLSTYNIEKSKKLANLLYEKYKYVFKYFNV